jgi:hypothetical protein
MIYRCSKCGGELPADLTAECPVCYPPKAPEFSGLAYEAVSFPVKIMEEVFVKYYSFPSGKVSGSITSVTGAQDKAE